MRLLVELPEQENNLNEFYEFLRIREGKWTQIPDTEKLAIPGGKPLSYEQLDALMEASIASESRSIDAFTKEIKKKLSAGEPWDFSRSRANDYRLFVLAGRKKYTGSRPSILPSSWKQIKKTDKFSSYFSTLSESYTQKEKALLHKIETVDTGFRGVFY